MKTFVRETLWPVGTLMVASVIIGGAIGMASAKADTTSDRYVAANGPKICALISADPTENGIDTLVFRMMADGLSASEGGAALYTAGVIDCPENLTVLRTWAASPTPGAKTSSTSDFGPVKA